MKYYGPSLITQNELAGGEFSLAVPEGEVDEFYLCDNEGDPIFRVPEALHPEFMNYEDDDQWFSVLIAVAELVRSAEVDAYEVGCEWGKREQRKAVQKLLGLDQLDRIAEAIEEYVGRG